MVKPVNIRTIMGMNLNNREDGIITLPNNKESLEKLCEIANYINEQYDDDDDFFDYYDDDWRM